MEKRYNVTKIGVPLSNKLKSSSNLSSQRAVYHKSNETAIFAYFLEGLLEPGLDPGNVFNRTCRGEPFFVDFPLFGSYFFREGNYSFADGAVFPGNYLDD